jgi:magnesium-transporting ATPase (P-type)
MICALPSGLTPAMTFSAGMPTILATSIAVKILSALRSNPSSPYVLTAAYALADPPRETTASALATLREMGMQIKMG